MAPVQPIDLEAIPMATHERFMRLAIEQARRNPAFPVRCGDRAGGRPAGRWPRPPTKLRAIPTLHGEIAAINDYVAPQRPPGLGRDDPLHDGRALPDVHERHHLGRDRRRGLGDLDRDPEGASGFDQIDIASPGGRGRGARSGGAASWAAVLRRGDRPDRSQTRGAQDSLRPLQRRSRPRSGRTGSASPPRPSVASRRW